MEGIKYLFLFLQEHKLLSLLLVCVVIFSYFNTIPFVFLHFLLSLPFLFCFVLKNVDDLKNLDDFYVAAIFFLYRDLHKCI